MLIGLVNVANSFRDAGKWARFKKFVANFNISVVHSVRKERGLRVKGGRDEIID